MLPPWEEFKKLLGGNEAEAWASTPAAWAIQNGAGTQGTAGQNAASSVVAAQAGPSVPVATQDGRGSSPAALFYAPKKAPDTTAPAIGGNQPSSSESGESGLTDNLDWAWNTAKGVVGKVGDAVGNAATAVENFIETPLEAAELKAATGSPANGGDNSLVTPVKGTAPSADIQGTDQAQNASPISDTQKSLGAGLCKTAGSYTQEESGKIISYSDPGLGRDYDPYNIRDKSDCSAFVATVYKKNNINLPATCSGQYDALQEVKNRNDWQPGDVVFWHVGADQSGDGKEHWHVAIYTGGGEVYNMGSKGCHEKKIEFITASFRHGETLIGARRYKP